MNQPWIKVCGITRRKDAQQAVAEGVHALGFIFVAESPRRVSPDQVIEIAEGLPPQVARVGVFCNETPESVRDLAGRIGLSAVQAHGEESPEWCRAYGIPVVKVFRTGGDFTPDLLEPYRDFPILLDGFSSKLRGGTGHPADWETARRIRKSGFRVLLAGGLGPENVAAAARKVEPLAVDLNSGVESQPGIKDGVRIEAAVRELNRIQGTKETPWPW